MLKVSQGNPKPTDSMLMVTGSVAEWVAVKDLTAEYVSTAAGDYPRDGLREFVKPEGGRLFLAHADLPARVQAEEVRRIRKSAFMASLYSDNSPDANKIPLAFWGLVFVLVVFLGFAAARK